VSLKLPELDLTDIADPVETARQLVEFARARATRSMWYSRLAGSTIIIATASIPIFLVLSTKWLEFEFGKVAPTALAAVAAVTGGFAQVERPNERWKLYRRYQRMFEAELLRFENRTPEYAADDRVTHFVDRLNQLHLAMHDEWAGIIPRSADLAGGERRAQ